MKFQVSEKIRSQRAKEELTLEIERKLKAIASKVKRDKQGNLVATDIEASFGSINRFSSVTISMRKSDDGWFISGDVVYKPSKMFWLFVIIGLCIPPFILVILPLVFYIWQKGTVRKAIEACFVGMKNEFDMPPNWGGGHATAPNSSLAELEKLASLKASGVITAAEFEGKKRQLLGL